MYPQKILINYYIKRVTSSWTYSVFIYNLINNIIITQFDWGCQAYPVSVQCTGWPISNRKFTQPSLYLYCEGCVIICGYLWGARYLPKRPPHFEQKFSVFFHCSKDQPLVRVCAVTESTIKRPIRRSVNLPPISASTSGTSAVSPLTDSKLTQVIVWLTITGC